jgi:hypothetical protein
MGLNGSLTLSRILTHAIHRGSSLSSYDGAMYFPKGQVSFTGSSGATTKCAMVIANTLNFSGNTNLQNNTTGGGAATTVPGKTIRLIA